MTLGGSNAVAAEDALRCAARVARACMRAAPDAIAGTILHGSLTLGDDVPGCSDVAVLAVADRRLTGSQRAALVDAVTRERRGAPGRLDLWVVTRQHASTPTPAPALELELVADAGCAGGLRVGSGTAEGGLVVELSICRLHGRRLTGLEPSELIGDVPDEWVANVGRAQLLDWQALPYEPRYAELMVFTACRVWLRPRLRCRSVAGFARDPACFAEERRHCSESAAAEWALCVELALPAVREALHRRHGDRAAALPEEAVRRLLELALARVAAAPGQVV